MPPIFTDEGKPTRVARASSVALSAGWKTRGYGATVYTHTR